MGLIRPSWWALTVVAVRRTLTQVISHRGVRMLSIAYVSAAAVEMTDGEIAAILVQARANNIRHDLTGALLYHRGSFIQILEGPDEHVLSRFAVISADPRHPSISVVSEESIRERQFPEWTMGFRPHGRSTESVVGIRRFLRRTHRRGATHARRQQGAAVPRMAGRILVRSRVKRVGSSMPPAALIFERVISLCELSCAHRSGSSPQPTSRAWHPFQCEF